MRIVCDGLTLADAVLRVSKALPQKVSNPVLEGIKLTARGDNLVLFATDLDLTIEKSIQADVITEGEVVVPGKLFTEYTRKLTNEQQIELILTNEQQLLIKYTDSEGVLQCLDGTEYPAFSQEAREDSFLIGEEEFQDMINKVIFSVSVDDARPILKGIYLEIEEYTVTAVALDGFRMAICKKPLEKPAHKMSAIVPSRSMNEISKLLEGGDNIATAQLDDKTLVIKASNTTISTRLLAGEYINYKQIIPKDYTTSLTINKEQLTNALDRVSILSRGEKKNLVTMDIKENLLEMTANSELGNIKENIGIRLWGKDMTISFNAKYVNDCLKVVPHEFVKMSFITSINPCIITPPESDEYLYLILPIRTI
ncbi:MAG: DNA polymerase III subunit beta [Clostridia bacterium]|nr:DNA polymerase III subunit beta [Clostridia bacterium]